MKIAIDISAEDFEKVKCGRGAVSMMRRAIIHGAPLPKGHGRLGDLDELEKRISNYVERDAKITDDYIVARQRFIVDGIRDTPTIIEADTESEDK